VGFPTFEIKDSRRPALKVLSTLMGGGASSRLFQEVREKRGLCYYIHMGVEQYLDTGNIVTQAGVAKDIVKVKEALRATMKEHTKLVAGQIKEADISRSKEMIKGRLLLSLEDSFNVSHYFGLKELHENIIETPEEVMAKIDKVTKEEIVALAGEIFTRERLNFSIIGPFEKDALNIRDLEF
jgi:predicted Zn-dependent peptidase